MVRVRVEKERLGMLVLGHRRDGEGAPGRARDVDVTVDDRHKERAVGSGEPPLPGREPEALPGTVEGEQAHLREGLLRCAGEVGDELGHTGAEVQGAPEHRRVAGGVRSGVAWEERRAAVRSNLPVVVVTEREAVDTLQKTCRECVGVEQGGALDAPAAVLRVGERRVPPKDAPRRRVELDVGRPRLEEEPILETREERPFAERTWDDRSEGVVVERRDTLIGSRRRGESPQAGVRGLWLSRWAVHVLKNGVKGLS